MKSRLGRLALGRLVNQVLVAVAAVCVVRSVPFPDLTSCAATAFTSNATPLASFMAPSATSPSTVPDDAITATSIGGAGITIISVTIIDVSHTHGDGISGSLITAVTNIRAMAPASALVIIACAPVTTNPLNLVWCST